jgi:hypothetical protein
LQQTAPVAHDWSVPAVCIERSNHVAPGEGGAAADLGRHAATSIGGPQTVPWTRRVAIVVAPDLGERVVRLASQSPVWVADTPANRAAVDQLRARAAGGEPGGRVTTFRVDPAGTPDDWAAAVIGAVAAHHAARSQAQAVDTLELHGVVVTDGLRAALAAHGFTDVTGDGDVTIARRPPAA